MTARRLVIVGMLATAILAAGCGTTPRPAPSAKLRSPPTALLNTSMATADGTWAVVVMGGSAAQHNNFWQLFSRPSQNGAWRLVTPPGTADNGGLVLAVGPRVLTAAFRPSQYLTYTPLIQTSHGGTTWTSLNPLDGPLASRPDALADWPGGGLLALLANGVVTVAGPGSATWRTLTSRRAIAATAVGRRCGLTALTAAALTSSGTPLLAGACAHQGTAGIFARIGGDWRLAGPALPTLARADITVLRLVQVGSQTIALLAAGRASAASLVVAWSNGGRWTLSPELTLGRAGILSASFGAGGITELQLSDRRGEIISPGRQWQSLPELPRGTATLAAGPRGTVDALAVHRATLTVWQTGPGASAWTATQSIRVPILFGSSG